MLVSFLDWKYIRLHCSVKKRTRSNCRSNVTCLSVTDHGSILAVNKFKPARIWSNIFLKVLWAVIFNFRPTTFEAARFTDQYWKINFSRSQDSQTFGATCLRLVELEHTYFLAHLFCIYRVIANFVECTEVLFFNSFWPLTFITTGGSWRSRF